VLIDKKPQRKLGGERKEVVDKPIREHQLGENKKSEGERRSTTSLCKREKADPFRLGRKGKEE